VSCAQRRTWQTCSFAAMRSYHCLLSGGTKRTGLDHEILEIPVGFGHGDNILLHNPFRLFHLFCQICQLVHFRRVLVPGHHSKRSRTRTNGSHARLLARIHGAAGLWAAYCTQIDSNAFFA
jgi:hypothetical protein